MEVEVRHNEGKSRFEAEVDGGVAVADYRRSDGRVAFTHTEVPLPARGHGIGSALARAAIAWARDEGLEVDPVCPFIAAWLRRNDPSAPTAETQG